MARSEKASAEMFPGVCQGGCHGPGEEDSVKETEVLSLTWLYPDSMTLTTVASAVMQGSDLLRTHQAENLTSSGYPILL